MKKVTIADNEAYTIDVAVEKNRAYLTIKGYWRNPEAVPDYLNDWSRALGQLTQGFTLLTDAREMKTHPQDVKEVHRQAQVLVKEKGVARVAELVVNSITEVQLNAVAKTTEFPKMSFRDTADAEKWLDEVNA